MEKTNYYKVGDHVFGVTAVGDDLARMMENYEPFRCVEASADGVVFTLNVCDGQAPQYEEEARQDDEGQVIICGKTAAHESVFEYQWQGKTAGWLVCSQDYRKATLYQTGLYPKMAIDNALMVVYAMATARLKTALFHAAVVCRNGKGFMFLGKSGTGKSTHASLWLQYIEGSELVNDDNPVVRMMDDGQARVYGSPWSGKTPCYRNVSCPVGGIVLLSQAPYNKIVRLSGIEAYAALMSSISGKRWDRAIADGLHETKNLLASHVPVYHLDCLPDEAAAQLSAKRMENG